MGYSFGKNLCLGQFFSIVGIDFLFIHFWLYGQQFDACIACQSRVNKMSFNFHAISKFRDSEAIFADNWTNIANFIKNINDYLAVENDLIVGEIKKDASKFSKKRRYMCS